MTLSPQMNSQLENIVSKYTDWYDQICTTDTTPLQPRQMGCISIYRCDICDSNKCEVNAERTCFLAQISHNHGVQMCMHCVEKKDREYYIYKMCLYSNNISWGVFTKMVNASYYKIFVN